MKNSNRQNQPIKWYAPKNTIDNSLNAWANDPCSILYDQNSGLYYSWMLFRNGRDFPSNWIEMTSPDLNTWTQTEERIKQGREFFNVEYPAAAMGGSVWVDKEGKFFDKGDLVFLISMQKCRLMGDDTNSIGENVEDSAIAYYVSHGFGQPIIKAGVLTPKGQNPTSTDWRDPYMYENEDGLHFAISAHNRVEFWKINSFNVDDIVKVDEIFVRELGVEVPNIVKFENDLWYISCSVQDAPISQPFQSAFWYICKVVNKKFEIIQKGVHEYGTEGYAHRVSNPWQSSETNFAVMRAMPSNWAYNTDIWEWKGGCFGIEKLTIENNKTILKPFDNIGPFTNNGTAVYNLTAKDLENGYELKFDKGSFTFYLRDGIVCWDNDVETKLNKWTNLGGKTNKSDNLIIVFNKTTLTFYNTTEGWNAHFMLPEKIKHFTNKNVKGLI